MGGEPRPPCLRRGAARSPSPCGARGGRESTRELCAAPVAGPPPPGSPRGPHLARGVGGGRLGPLEDRSLRGSSVAALRAPTGGRRNPSHERIRLASHL